jgi:hypothetical protein
LVAKTVGKNAIMFLSLPGPRGKAKAALPLNTPQIQSTAAQSRSQLRVALEGVLRRLSEHDFVDYVMENSGNDVSTE